MTQISILKGIYVDQYANFRTALPRNLEPIISDNGISKGYLRTVPGISYVTSGPGADRGSVNWNGAGYRVMGTRLILLNGSSITDLGDVGAGGPVSLDYSFDRLAIASGGQLYYLTGGILQQVTDPDLGTVVDMLWVAGYFMTTDGVSVIVTELNDPFAVDPNKYGSSEADPDPMMALRKVRNEVYVLNRYTIENLLNVGGNGFPFQANNGGLIPKGCVGPRARCDFLQTFAFAGGARNEAISIYLAGAGEAISLGTPEVDRLLAELTDDQQLGIELESRTLNDEQKLYVRLPDKTLVYSHSATEAAGFPVWHIIAGGALADQSYPGAHFSLVAGQWVCGSPDGSIGVLTESVETQFGQVAGWEFSTTFNYNGGQGAIVKSLELVAATGNALLGPEPTIFMAISQDGRSYGQERAIGQGSFGNTAKRLQWRPKIRFANYAAAKFRGANTALASFARLEAEFEGLSV